MKSSSAFYIGTAMLLISLLAGCGQPGPLYLPKPPAAEPAAAKHPIQPAAVPPPPEIAPQS